MRNKTKREEELIQILGDKIRSLRKQKGYSNADIFAYENDIDRSQYGKYERGMDMTFSSIVRITDALGVTLQDFFAKDFELPLQQNQPNKK